MTPLQPSWVAEAACDDAKVYPTVEAWVTEWLAPVIQRPSAGRCWCPSWWAHPEAAWRLTALWLAWEALTIDGATGPSSWWLHHCDRTSDSCSTDPAPSPAAVAATSTWPRSP